MGVVRGSWIAAGVGYPAGGGALGARIVVAWVSLDEEWRGAGRGGARLGPEPALENFTGEGRLLLSAFALDGV